MRGRRYIPLIFLSPHTPIFPENTPIFPENTPIFPENTPIFPENNAADYDEC